MIIVGTLEGFLMVTKDLLTFSGLDARFEGMMTLCSVGCGVGDDKANLDAAFRAGLGLSTPPLSFFRFAGLLSKGGCWCSDGWFEVDGDKSGDDSSVWSTLRWSLWELVYK